MTEISPKQRELAKCKRAAYAAKGDAKIDAVHHWMLVFKNEERIAELVPFLAEAGLTDEQFWRIFLRIWTMCDAAYHWNDRLRELFLMRGPCPPAWLPDREFYDSLPEALTVYRGADRSRIEEAISWTTDRRVAERFARGHLLHLNPDPVVATATVRKSEIFAATNGRQESEILCLPDIERIEPFGKHREPGTMTTIHTIYFFADDQQCRAWDEELLSIHPAYATAADQTWRTIPGWYWRIVEVDLDTGEGDGDVLDEGGPHATKEECRRDARDGCCGPLVEGETLMSPNHQTTNVH